MKMIRAFSCYILYLLAESGNNCWLNFKTIEIQQQLDTDDKLLYVEL